MKDMKKKPEMDMHREAKMSVLKELKDMASSMMGDDLKGAMEKMKKVTVASPSRSGLEEGLSKARELVASQDENDMMHQDRASSSDAKDPIKEAMADIEEEQSEHEDINHSDLPESEDHEDMDHDAIDAEIKRLMDKKNSMPRK